MFDQLVLGLDFLPKGDGQDLPDGTENCGSADAIRSVKPGRTQENPRTRWLGNHAQGVALATVEIEDGQLTRPWPNDVPLPVEELGQANQI